MEYIFTPDEQRDALFAMLSDINEYPLLLSFGGMERYEKLLFKNRIDQLMGNLEAERGSAEVPSSNGKRDPDTLTKFEPVATAAPGGD